MSIALHFLKIFWMISIQMRIQGVHEHPQTARSRKLITIIQKFPLQLFSLNIYLNKLRQKEFAKGINEKY